MQIQLKGARLFQSGTACVLLLALALAACGGGSTTSPAGTAGSVQPTTPVPPVTVPPAATVPPFEAIHLVKIPLPSSISDASTPTWTQDGGHLLFFSQGGGSTGHLYIVNEDGTGLKCLSCGVKNEPAIAASEQEGLAYALADGKRAFLGVYGAYTMLECTPSLIDCTSAQILPIDVSAARTTSPTGVLDLGGGAAPHLAPDGIHLAFSDVRSDAAELMVMGTLVRQDSGYLLTDPRVINPSGPSGLLDSSPMGWSAGGQLYEFKSFADGGATATYVAEPGSGNPDVIKVNLATGKTTRLTAHPDWDEDNAPSPDGSSIIVESDRGMHRTDMFGLMPVRSFIDTPVIAAAAIYFVSSPARRQCDLQPWLFPANGDANATLMGQPLYPYTGGDVHGANNISGMAQWSPDGTKVALNLMSYSTNMSPPYLVVAHLTRAPTQPLPTVSSAAGSWAVSPANYHGAIQSNQLVLVNGQASGNALITYTGLGVVAGVYTVTYNHYSDDGLSFVDGTDTIIDDILTNTVLLGALTYTSHLKMTGAHTGSRDADLVFTLPTTASNTSVIGSVTSTYDGTSSNGPPSEPMNCPDALPKAQPLAFTTTVSGNQLVVNVTSSIKGAGANMAKVDTRPVWGAMVSLNGVSASTDRNGNASLTMNGSRADATLQVSAGDTMVATSGIVHLK